jgi:hypothetical protein
LDDPRLKAARRKARDDWVKQCGGQLICEGWGDQPPHPVATLRQLHADHEFEVSLGGPPDPGTYRIRCASCNSTKSNMMRYQAQTGQLTASARPSRRWGTTDRDW